MEKPFFLSLTVVEGNPDGEVSVFNMHHVTAMTSEDEGSTTLSYIFGVEHIEHIHVREKLKDIARWCGVRDDRLSDKRWMPPPEHEPVA